MFTPVISFDSPIPLPGQIAEPWNANADEDLVRRVGLSNGPDWRSIAFASFVQGKIKTKHLLGDRKFARMWSAYTEVQNAANGEEADLPGHFRQASRITLDRPRQLEFHARVLARQDIATIADLMGIAPLVVETYEDFYFDVRPSIEARSWIGTHVFHRSKFARDSIERHLLTNAYYGGSVALENALQTLRQFGSFHDLTTTLGQQRERLELVVLVQQFITDTSKIPVKLVHDLKASSPDEITVSRSPGQLLYSQSMQTLGGLLAATEAKQESTTPLRTRVAV